MEAIFCGLTKRDVCSLAHQLVVHNNIFHPFKNETDGINWFYVFMKRNPDLSVRNGYIFYERGDLIKKK